MSTSQKIVSKSIQLFNRHGVEAISINQICSVLKISPGNFTYHFNKKSDLVAFIFRQFEEQLAQTLDNIPANTDQNEFGNAVYELMDLVYRHRHIFLGASYLIKNELISRSDYQAMVKETKARFRHLLDRLIADGKMAPINAPYSVTQLVDNIWWQWLGWLLAMQITPPSQKTRKQLLADELLNILFLNGHYVDPKFFKEIRKEILALSQ